MKQPRKPRTHQRTQTRTPGVWRPFPTAAVCPACHQPVQIAEAHLTFRVGGAESGYYCGVCYRKEVSNG